MRYLRFVFVALAIGAVAAGPLPSAAAQTAPKYQSSDPAKDEMLDHPPAEVTVTFDQPLDQSSAMNVYDECGNEIDAGAATVNLNEMTVGIGKTPAGMYEVVYKAVGLAGATGSSGATFEFMVHHGKPCGDGKKPPHHGGKKRNGHGDHRKNDGGGNHGGHDDMGPGSDHSSGSGHSDMPMSGTTGHTGHSMGTGSQTGGHATGHGDHGPGRHGGPRQPDGTTTGPFATDGTVPVGADGQAVLLGLGLALAVGVLGGWLLRLSSNLTGA